MAAFDLALAHVRNGAEDFLLPERINQLALDHKHRYRNTVLTPGKTLGLFVQQVAQGNVACSAMRHLAGEDFSDSAWCQARSRLPLEIIEQVFREVVQQGRREMEIADDAGVGDVGVYRWRGHRLHVLDGTNDSMPDTSELRDHYGVSQACQPELGFPTSQLLLLMDLRSGLLIDCVDSPMNTSETTQTSSAHGHLQEGDVLLGDDAFSGWGHLALVLQANLHYVGPVHHRRIVNFDPNGRRAHPRKSSSVKRTGKPRSRIVKTPGRDDQQVEYFKPWEKPPWISQEQWSTLPESITVREIRRTVGRHGFRPITVTIVTTLLDPDQYPADELIELRLSRWMVETNIRHLKTTLGMDVLKCKTLDGIRKERLIFLLVYNLIRLLMLRATRRQGVDVNRVSFADTLAWLRLGKLQQCPDLVVNPMRPGRLQPRGLKRNLQSFPFMTKPRAKLKSQLREKYCVAT
jgi:Transposase DDE domain